MTVPASTSKWAHPPRSNTPRSSSSGPPGPCITPSTETCVVVVSFMSQSLLAEFVGVRLLLDRGADRIRRDALPRVRKRDFAGSRVGSGGGPLPFQLREGGRSEGASAA